MTATVDATGEEALIARMCARVPHAPSPLGPGDDGAMLPPSTEPRALTTDVMVEGVHFLRAHPPRWLGHKLLAVNLSDVSAMGGQPEAFVVTAALPPDTPVAWWDALADGLGELAREAGVMLAGGDVVRSVGPVALGITAWGGIPGGRPLERRGGRAGDVLMVAGAVGRSGAGLRRWLQLASSEAWGEDPPPAVDPLVRAHLRPEPPLGAGRIAVEAGAHAGLDLSDGLAIDAGRLARASGVDLLIDLDRLPPDAACAALGAAARAGGGEDLGLLVLAPPGAAAVLAGRGFHALGSAGEREAPAARVRWRLDGEPTDLDERPFTHFAGG